MELVIGIDEGNTATKIVWSQGQVDDGCFVESTSGYCSFASEMQVLYNINHYMKQANHFNSKSVINTTGVAIEFNKVAYAVGTAISGNVGIVHKKDFDKYSKDYYIPMLVCGIESAISTYPIKSNEEINIRLFCTCQITGKSDVARWIRENCIGEFKYKTLYRGQLVERRIKIADVVVYAEPVGTAIYFLYSTNRLPDKTSDYIVFDFGGLTTDALRFTARGNDKSTIQNVQFASRPFSCNALISEIKDILISKLPKHYNERVPDAHIIQIILSGDVYGDTDDKRISKMISARIETFLETVVTALESELGGRKLDDYDKAIVTGGGASLLDDYFQNENIVNINNGVQEFPYNNARGAFAVYNVVCNA